MILTENIEQNNLKLIKVNEGYVVVNTDQDSEIGLNNYMYDIQDNEVYINRGYGVGDYKVLFASKDLKLEGVTIIIDWYYLTKTRYNKYYTNPKDLKDIIWSSLDNFKIKGAIEIKDDTSFRMGFLEGHRFQKAFTEQVQNELYTKEQVIQILDLVGKNYHKKEDKLFTENPDGNEELFDRAYSETIEEAISEVKKIKVEVDLDNNTAKFI